MDQPYTHTKSLARILWIVSHPAPILWELLFLCHHIEVVQLCDIKLVENRPDDGAPHAQVNSVCMEWRSLHAGYACGLPITG